MSAFVDECRREWKRLGVPDSLAEEMASELEADLDEAAAEGVAAPEILGESDPRRFAANWAAARGLVSDGAPTEIVAAGAEEPEPSTRSGAWELATILLLLLGGFVFLVGWLVGVVLLWSSNVWTLRDKLLGTLIIPGGLATAVFFIGSVLFAGALGSSSACVHHLDGTTTGSCTGGPSILTVVGITAGLALVLIAPLVTAAYLKRRLNKHSVPVAIPQP